MDTASSPAGAPLRSKRKKWIFILVLVALLALIAPPFVSLNRFRGRVSSTLSQSVGRPVTIGSVGMQLLPQPGLNLQDLAVADDPEFSAEPLLHADAVTATLRLASLWRGRMEIAGLSFRNPSLNLVRLGDGRWNVESLLTRAAQTPSAPTSRRNAETRPRFPYIEASSARINWKQGREKKVFALDDADFALWLASEDQWRVELKARPIRTDDDLSNTGVLRLSARVERAADLRATPVQLQLSLEKAQLGQLTQLIYGRDRGWRGGVNLDAILSGTPAAMSVEVFTRLEDFHRYDIGGGGFSLNAHCKAELRGAEPGPGHSLEAIECSAPVDDGEISASGRLPLPPPERLADWGGPGITLRARAVPLAAVARLLRHVKRDLPADFTASGLVQAAFGYPARMTRPPRDAQALWFGTGVASSVRLHSRALGADLDLGNIRFHMPLAEDPRAASAKRLALLPRSGKTAEQRLLLDAFPADLGAAKPATVSAWFGGSGYALDVKGDGDLGRVISTARSLGLRTPAAFIGGKGRVHMEVEMSGGWTGFAPYIITGSAQVQQAGAEVRGWTWPLEIASANLTLTASEVAAQNLKMSLAGSQPGATTNLEGWVKLPRNCAPGESCAFQFDLRADKLILDDVNRLLNPRLRATPWYAFGSAEQGSPQWMAALRGYGVLSSHQVMVKNVTLREFTARLEMNAGRLRLADVRADLFGGKHTGEWSADLTGEQPTYTGTGAIEHVALEQIGTAMRDNWAAGAARVEYEVRLGGWDLAALARSASGAMDFEWKNGALTHLALENPASPMRFTRFTGKLAWKGNGFALTEGRFESSGGEYDAAGSISLGRELEITIARGDVVEYAVSGTMAQPRVERKTPVQTGALAGEVKQP